MRRLSHALLLGVVLLLVVGVLGGCGGGGSGTDTSAVSVPAQGSAEAGGNAAKGSAEVGGKFVKEADDLCRVTSERQAMVMEEAEANGTLDKQTASSEELAANIIVLPYVTMIQEFERLKVPAADEAERKALLEAFKERLTELEADPESAGSGESTSKADELASEYGLTSCSI